MTKYSEFIAYLPTGNRNNDLCAITALPISQNLMLKSASLTHRFVCHAHISRCPATKSTGQVIGFLHRGLGWVIWKLCGNACCPSGEGVHTAGTVKAVGASRTRQTIIDSFNKYLPSTYYVPDIVLHVRNSRENYKGSVALKQKEIKKYSEEAPTNFILKFQKYYNNYF